MNTEFTYEQVLELLPAYALGALEPEEMLAVDAYVKNNPALLERLHQAEAAAAQMVYVAPDVPLPANAREQLMARIHADPAESGHKAVPSSRRQNQATEHSVGWLAGFRSAFRSANLWVAATSCALVALIVVFVYLNRAQTQLEQISTQLADLQNEISQLQETNASLQQQLLTNQGQLDQASTDLDAAETQMAELQASNGHLQQQVQADQELLALITTIQPERIVQLPGTEEAPDASGAFYLGADKQGLVVLNGLPPLSTGQTYQLWLIPAEGPPKPAGLLAVTTDTTAWQTVSVSPDAENFAAVGVSIEPAGGSPTPTGPIVLLSKIG